MHATNLLILSLFEKIISCFYLHNSPRSLIGAIEKTSHSTRLKVV